MMVDSDLALLGPEDFSRSVREGRAEARRQGKQLLVVIFEDHFDRTALATELQAVEMAKEHKMKRNLLYLSLRCQWKFGPSSASNWS